MNLSRRLFISGTAASALGGSVDPAKAAPLLSPREQALWHMRELERLTLESGAGEACIVVMGSKGAFSKCKALSLTLCGQIIDQGLFQSGEPAVEGGASD